MSDAAASTPKPEGDDKSDASTITIRVRDQVCADRVYSNHPFIPGQTCVIFVDGDVRNPRCKFMWEREAGRVRFKKSKTAFRKTGPPSTKSLPQRTK